MNSGIIQRSMREYALFFIVAIIGSVVYLVIERILTNKLDSILFTSLLTAAFIILIVYIFFKKREKLLGIVDIFDKFEDAPSTLEIIKNANISIEFIGISARTFLESESVEEIMKKKISQGISFKFLILDPSSKFVEIKAKDEGDDLEAWKYDINGSIRRITKIKNETNPEQIELKTYDSLPIWRGIFVDNKFVYTTYYPHGYQGKHSPVFLIENKSDNFYTPLYNHFRYSWEYLGKEQ